MQPVRLVPVGRPIPALPAQDPAEERLFSLPAFPALPFLGGKGGKKGGGRPRPSYGAPKPSYGAPKPSYAAPKPSYSAPKPSYGVPAPRPSYNAPSSGYSAGLAAPALSSGGGAGADSYGTALAAPISGASSFQQGQQAASFQSALAGSGGYTAQARPSRGSAAQDCYCAAKMDCPAWRVVNVVTPAGEANYSGSAANIN